FHPDGNYFIGADTGIFWQIAKEPLEGCKAPDWYRNSYVILSLTFQRERYNSTSSNLILLELKYKLV
ncbi:MAG: hypothetical protein L0220_01240, partial [Acidobacteria bacterium]|nr:hypothetical protein [Acidobacteriota bacterium]